MEITYHGRWLWDSPYDGEAEPKDYTQDELDALEAVAEEIAESQYQEEFYDSFN